MKGEQKGRPGDALVVNETLNPHSVEVGRSAAGATTFGVKVYGADPARCREQAVAIYRELEEQFPFVRKA